MKEYNNYTFLLIIRNNYVKSEQMTLCGATACEEPARLFFSWVMCSWHKEILVTVVLVFRVCY